MSTMTQLTFAVGAVVLLGLLEPTATTTPGIPEGQPYDVTMTASTDFTYPMRDVDLVGVFSGPAGRGLVLPGFWDGGRTFRIRFTPTAAGEWTYTTVSSDPGLDSQTGTVEATAPDPVAAGFATGASVRRPIAACEPDCAALFGGSEERPDLTRLHALDVTVADAQRAGVLVDMRLFARESDAAIVDAHAHGMMEYLIARYAAYPNIVWCAGSAGTPAGAGSRAAVRGLVRTLDPYFAVGDWRRPVFASCGPAT
jgi:hypothetical protein